MKKILRTVIGGLAIVLLIGISSCAKTVTCNDASAPNYKQEGACIDLPTSSGILGTYTGTIADSIYGSPPNVYYNEQIIITKIDDSHIQVSGSGNLVNFTASMVTCSNGDGIIIPYQISTGNNSGIAISGAQISNGSACGANGAFVASTKQFVSATTFVISGSTYIEYFVGTHQ
jgi:hypothetical protein